MQSAQSGDNCITVDNNDDEDDAYIPTQSLCMFQKMMKCTLCNRNVTHLMCHWHFLTSDR